MKITFIQTGGTIDKDYPNRSGAYAFEIFKPAFTRILEEIRPKFEYDTIEFIKKDSQEITPEDRRGLRALIESLETQKVIVTHGTDTIIETARNLLDINGKTIVLTGAKLPERFSGSDASFNIGTAIGAVQSKTGGVYIAMGGLVIPAELATRDEKTGVFTVSKK